MTDPMAVANLAVSLMGKTTDALSALRQRAQRSKDVDIKDQINTMFDAVLSLKDVVARLVDENKRLHDQLEQRAQRPTLKQVGDTNYYYRGDEGPFCQSCYDGQGKEVSLLPSEPWNNGIRRQCPVCHEFFYEKRMNIKSETLFGGGPNSWMR